MDFVSFEFVAFLAVVVPLYYIVPVSWRPWCLVVCSFAFYALWSVPFACLMLCLGLLGYATGLAIRPGADSPGPSGSGVFVVGGTLIIAVLVFFKATPFLTNSLAGTGWLERYLIFPLGLSYYTFKILSYLIEISWGRLLPERSAAAFLAYVAFFPQLVSGPIQRPGDFLAQLRGTHALSVAALKSALLRLLAGVFKKTVIADNLALYLNSFSGSGQSDGSALLLFYLFPLQLYADFSALTDIALAVGGLFGIQGPENFDRPFAASTISQYWRRWHMSLTSWLSDYVFMPARMLLRNWGNLGLAASIAFNMCLIGIWHAFSLNFLFFGLFHSVLLIADALTVKARSRYYKARPSAAAAMEIIGPVAVYQMVAAGMVFVRAATAEEAFTIFRNLVHLPASGMLPVGAGDLRRLVYGLAGLGAYTLVQRACREPRVAAVVADAPLMARLAFYYAVIGVIVVCGGPAQPFIYFKF